jgi:uncharacterized phage protein (TIGR02218 family)
VSGAAALQAHLAGGTTTVARCFAVVRGDGLVLGFTDHDRDLSFDGVEFRAGTGLTARAIQQGTGLAVDNSEALGALSSAAITEADIAAGRYDGAEVTAWLVNWQDVTARRVLFRGRLGDITRKGGAFTAELRGLSDALNEPRGRIYHARCSAVLGDGDCGFDLSAPGYATERAIEVIEEARVLRFAVMAGFAEHWFEKGRVRVLTGPAAGLTGIVKNDRVIAGGGRLIEMWQALGAAPGPGDVVRIEAGCDKRVETCQQKFLNFLNFRGFPHVPGEDWLMSYPVSGGNNSGGSLRG